jgi:hypothetical protein
VARVQPSTARRPYADEQLLRWTFIIGWGSALGTGLVLGYLVGFWR